MSYIEAYSVVVIAIALAIGATIGCYLERYGRRGLR